MTNLEIYNVLQKQFGNAIHSMDEPHKLLTIVVSAGAIIPILKYLKEDPLMNYLFLTDLCGVHQPNIVGEELGIIYHLHNLQANRRLRIKTYVSAKSPKIDTVITIWKAANWMERETFDFYGIQFIGHPNLTRILNIEDMNYHPMLKHYPLEDGTRTDKADSYFGR